MRQRTRLVFANIVREPVFAQMAAELGWRAAGEPQQYANSIERVWTPDSVNAAVTYVDDRLLQLQYLIVEGPIHALMAIHESVSPRSPFYSRDLIRELMDPARPDSDPILGLYVAALIAPQEADPEILSWFADAMRHSDLAVRRAAYFATTYPGWPEFEPLLLKASEEDPTPEGRKAAAETIASLKRHAWKEE